MDLYILILLVYGLTNIIVRGTLFESLKDKLEDRMLNTKSSIIKWSLRHFLTLINCPMCTGFHVGWIVGIWFGPFAAWNVICNGALFSGTTWIINAVVQFFGQGSDPERDVNVFVHPQSSVNVINTDEKNNDDKREVLNG